MKSFKKVENETIYFSSCENCEAQCCSGKMGSLYAQIILEDFEKCSKYFPILFMFGELGYLKPVILLSNGKDFCKYIKDLKCSIYENRPSICRNYPLSAHLDNHIYLDTTCPALGDKGKIVFKNGILNKDFNTYKFEEYQENYVKTHFNFENFNKKENLTKAITLKAIDFYKFKEDFNNKFIKLHLQSLKNLDSYYL